MTDAEIAEFKPRIEALMHRTRRMAARAEKRGDRKRATYLRNASTHYAEALEHVDAITAARAKDEISGPDEEKLRADMRANIAAFVAAALELQAWEAKRDAFLEALGRGDMTAEDPGSAPYTEAALEAIAAGAPFER